MHALRKTACLAVVPYTLGQCLKRPFLPHVVSAWNLTPNPWQTVLPLP